ncbi:hypothetical protein MPER_04551 [Moniliophthora perniciosa FA553]|nr:hypothetical protein MPER_04551 [Moniliophthora perniciosa FA553]
MTEEEEERARKERIAAKLASMGGMRFGMMPGMVAPPKPSPPPRERGQSESSAPAATSPRLPLAHPPPVPGSHGHPPPSTGAAPPTRTPPPPQELECDYGGSQGTSDDGVKV